MKISSIKPKISTIDLRRGTAIAVERIRGDSLRKIRDRIGLRDECTCQVCGRVTAHGEVDHKVPLYLGGQESDENRWWLCRDCHASKSVREERERGGAGQISGDRKWN